MLCLRGAIVCIIRMSAMERHLRRIEKTPTRCVMVVACASLPSLYLVSRGGPSDLCTGEIGARLVHLSGDWC